ncbi:MAG: DUF192 domain-containing protein [Rhodospirillales bacterium]|nr:DUF192 domain-containing protein [Rhodospirillales bacterium]MCB9995768.1 DUF192 domain-containing protein [Rhodospirillales bacterium]
MRYLILSFLTICFLLSPQHSGACSDEFALDTETLVIETPGGEKHKFHVEIAATPDTMTRGLMYRSSMAEDHGMYFMFPTVKDRNFWMKNTLIPLDIIYIREDGIINHIHENAVPLDETPIPSKGPVQNVLEINGGMAAKLGLKPGDKIYIEVPADKNDG